MYRVQETDVAFAVPRRPPCVPPLLLLAVKPSPSERARPVALFPYHRAKHDHNASLFEAPYCSILSYSQENGNGNCSDLILLNVEQEYHREVQKSNE